MANTPKINQDKEFYGTSLLLSFHDVPANVFKNEFIKPFLEALVDSINMTKGPYFEWGSDKNENDNPHPKAEGISAVQFLEESAVVGHFLDEIEKVYLDIFSCKEFDTYEAIIFCQKKLGGKLVQHQVITRI
jgi:S-adenosylmethionine/arginine decarboxylase-like enzyme